MVRPSGSLVRTGRTYLEIKNGDPADGPFTFKYDPEKEGHIPTPDTAWYVNSLMEFNCSVVPVAGAEQSESHGPSPRS